MDVNERLVVVRPFMMFSEQNIVRQTPRPTIMFFDFVKIVHIKNIFRIDFFFKFEMLANCSLFLQAFLLKRRT